MPTGLRTLPLGTTSGSPRCPLETRSDRPVTWGTNTRLRVASAQRALPRRLAEAVGLQLAPSTVVCRRGLKCPLTPAEDNGARLLRTVAAMQEAGVAAVSLTILHRVTVLRMCTINRRRASRTFTKRLPRSRVRRQDPLRRIKVYPAVRRSPALISRSSRFPGGASGQIQRGSYEQDGW
jgi:hypothetical protein